MEPVLKTIIFVLLFASGAIIVAILPSLVMIIIEKITGKNFGPVSLNTEVDQSQGRAEGATIYTVNRYEGGDKV